MRLLLIAAVAASLAPAAAHAFDTAYGRSLAASYSTADLRALFSGDAPVEVIGAPGGDAQAVADAVAVPNYLGSPRFKAVPSTPETRQSSRLVLAFGGSGPICSATGAAGGSADKLSAAICYGDRAVARAQLRSDNLTDPNSPRFTRSVRSLIQYMAPRQGLVRARRGSNRD